MKKRVLAVIIIVSLTMILVPTVSRAVVTPYFTAVNDTLLPFNEDTMPYISSGEIYITHEMLSEVGVWSVAARELGRVRLWAESRYVDFYTGSATVMDHNGNDLPWLPVQRIGGRFYVPMRHVCGFFGLTYEVIPVSREIIPQEQTWVVRIRSEPGINEQSFTGVYRSTLREAYDAFHSTSSVTSEPTESAPGTGIVPEETPASEEPPPRYQDITIYLCFNNISGGGADVILSLLDIIAGRYYQLCFFVNEDDIEENGGIIRRLAGEGHTIGIRLKDGTYDEYLRTSKLLFEAAKLKTLIVMIDAAEEPAYGSNEQPEENPQPEMESSSPSLQSETLREKGLVLWYAAQGLIYDDSASVSEVTEAVTVERGTRQSLLTECSENSVLMLSGILAYLQEFEYTVSRINETTEPVQQH